jgi:hypothetical protein
MKRIIFPVLLLCLAFAASTSRAQTPTYYRAPLYSMPIDTSVPPLYLGQPSAVTTAYLWLDDLMRLEPEYAIGSYIKSLSSWNDTAQTIASNLYQIQDDNPLTYYNWDGAGLHTSTYKGVTGQAEYAFIKQVSQIETTGIAYVLLSSEIISDITVSDTVCYTDPTAVTAKDAILANCVINDEIKGKWVPACSGSPIADKTGISTFGLATTAHSAYPPDSASVGTCLQFQYSPEWKLNPNNQSGASLGHWIKPGQEYVVFLCFMGVGYNSANSYFTTEPSSAFGSSCGMYPVVSGIVQYPHDDLGLGGTNLTLSAFKTALRAKIKKLIG